MARKDTKPAIAPPVWLPGERPMHTMKNTLGSFVLLMLAGSISACEVVSSGLEDEPIEETTALELPEPTGAFRVGTTSLFVVDTDRDDEYTAESDQRELNVRIWYPADQEGFGTATYMPEEVVDLFSVTQDYLPADDMVEKLTRLRTPGTVGAPVTAVLTRLPIVFLSHGLGGVNSLYTTFGAELASHGFLVVAIDHTYGAFATVFPDGRIPSIRFGERAPPFPTVVNIWAKDLASVLDHLEELDTSDPSGLLTGRLDLTRVGAMGHSTGGSAAAEVLTFDSRFSAGVTLDAPQVGPAAEGAGVDDPLMLFFEDGSEYFSNAVANRLQAPGFSLTVQETTHYSFTDLPVLLEEAGVPVDVRNASTRPPGTLDPARNNTIINDWTLAFFDRYLRGGPGSLLDATGGRYPEVTARRIGVVSGPAS